MRTLLRSALALSLLSYASVATSAPAASPLAERFSTFDCSDGSTDVNRHWCPIALAGTGGFTAPDHSQIRLGLSLALPAGARPQDVVLNRTTLAVLYIGPEGAKVTTLTPSNEQEARDLARVITSVALSLKGMGPNSVSAKPDLLAYLNSQSTDLHPLTDNGRSSSFTGLHTGGDIERVHGTQWGDAYVVIETVSDGTHVSVFPDVGIIESQ